jgi:hypothetical protein
LLQNMMRSRVRGARDDGRLKMTERKPRPGLLEDT